MVFNDILTNSFCASLPPELKQPPPQWVGFPARGFSSRQGWSNIQKKDINIGVPQKISILNLGVSCNYCKMDFVKVNSPSLSLQLAPSRMCWRVDMYMSLYMQVAWKPVPFLSVLPICVTNARAGFIAICSISCTFSVLFTDLKMLIFSSQICDKKNHQIFKICISWGFRALLAKNCSNCFFVFDLSNCQGGVGGGMITFLELAHMFDATQIGGFGMLTFF